MDRSGRAGRGRAAGQVPCVKELEDLDPSEQERTSAGSGGDKWQRRGSLLHWGKKSLLTVKGVEYIRAGCEGASIEFTLDGEMDRGTTLLPENYSVD